ncbi:MAG: NAD(P)/FAD-dependent oxidoreductase [Halobacteria archaeon]|nr:NAD(P)/FAD-dependent oxidoreductase [Halobacteria archaeon]
MTGNQGQENDGKPSYEVIVVGGGPAGLTTALYTTRLGHNTAVINRGGGRAAMMQDAHNIIGVKEEVSGREFLKTAVEQYGADYYQDVVTDITQVEGDSECFLVETPDEKFIAERVVLATGFSDVPPSPPAPRTGRGLHYCLHCDAYMFVDESVYVMGHSDSAAYVAMIMLNFTDEVDLLLDGDDPTWSDETDERLRAHPIDIVEEEVTEVNKDRESGWMKGFVFDDGTERDYKGGFAMYGSKYNNDLAKEMGVELNSDGRIVVDDHGKTSVPGVYAVGDIVPGHNQIPVAMGQGAKAGIAIHKELRTYPKSMEELRAESETDSPAISSDFREAATSFGEGD